MAPTTTLTADLTTGVNLWQGAALLAPEALLAADARVYIFDSAEAFTVATTLAAVAAIGVAGTAGLNPTTVLGAAAVQQMRAAAVLAPTTLLGADVRTFIFDTEALSAVSSLAALAQLRMPTQAALAPAAALAAVQASLRLPTSASFAPTTTFVADARTFIFDLSEALSVAAALASAPSSILVAARARWPRPRRWR